MSEKIYWHDAEFLKNLEILKSAKTDREYNDAYRSIHPYLYKLAEFATYQYPIYDGDIEGQKNVLVSHLFSKLEKFDPLKSTNSFYFFNTVAMRHQMNEKRTKTVRDNKSISTDVIDEFNRSCLDTLVDNSKPTHKIMFFVNKKARVKTKIYTKEYLQKICDLLNNAEELEDTSEWWQRKVLHNFLNKMDLEDRNRLFTLKEFISWKMVKI
jgi:hypothetical protein